MSNLFVTTAIGYETRGANEDPAANGNTISRVGLAVRWDTVTAISEIEHPSICFDDDSVNEPLSLLTTKHGSFHIRCAYSVALKLWQEWEVSANTYKLATN